MAEAVTTAISYLRTRPDPALPHELNIVGRRDVPQVDVVPAAVRVNLVARLVLLLDVVIDHGFYPPLSLLFCYLSITPLNKTYNSLTSPHTYPPSHTDFAPQIFHKLFYILLSTILRVFILKNKGIGNQP